MPVRIYDISKKLGLENKEVLSKAKELGIAAKVASSSLDKITAEYLEQQLVIAYPDRIAQPAAAPAPAAPVVEDKIRVVHAPPPETESVREAETTTETATAVLEPEPPQAPEKTEAAAPPESPAAPPAPPAEEVVAKAPPQAPPPPPEPAGPRVGDK